jgi:hypothetical protein
MPFERGKTVYKPLLRWYNIEWRFAWLALLLYVPIYTIRGI